MAVTKKTGNIIGAMTLTQEQLKTSDILLMSRDGQTIRLPLKGIRVTSRVTQGVILTKIRGNDDAIIRASLMTHSDEEE